MVLRAARHDAGLGAAGHGEWRGVWHVLLLLPPREDHGRRRERRGGSVKSSYLTQSINSRVLESQIPHIIVNLMFTVTS